MSGWRRKRTLPSVVKKRATVYYALSPTMEIFPIDFPPVAPDDTWEPLIRETNGMAGKWTMSAVSSRKRKTPPTPTTSIKPRTRTSQTLRTRQKLKIAHQGVKNTVPAFPATSFPTWEAFFDAMEAYEAENHLKLSVRTSKLTKTFNAYVFAQSLVYISFSQLDAPERKRRAPRSPSDSSGACATIAASMGIYDRLKMPTSSNR